LVGYSFSNFSTGLSLQNSFGRGPILGCEPCNETASYIGTVSSSGLPVLIDGVSAGTGKIIQNIDWEESVSESVPTSVLQGFSTTRISTNTWAKCAAANGTLPYLIAIFPSDPCAVGSGSGGTRSVREKVERDPRELKESRTPEKIEKTLGFKMESSLQKSALISFVETTEKLDITKVKAVEIVKRYSTALDQIKAAANDAMRINAEAALAVAVQQGAAMFEDIHSSRSNAFSPSGAGYADFANYRWQAGKQSGVVPALKKIHSMSKEASERFSKETYGIELPDTSTLLRRTMRK
jgi:hypothetical protein